MASKTAIKIAVIPGDGVGTEVASEAVKVGTAAAKIESTSLNFEWFDWGCDYYLKHGKMMHDDVLDVTAESQVCHWLRQCRPAGTRHYPSVTPIIMPHKHPANTFNTNAR